MHIYFGLLVCVLGLGIFFTAIKRCQNHCFYQDTHWLIPLGIFVWGDALILGPFWAISGLIFTQLSQIWVIRYLLLFASIRGGYEVIYWLNHQAVGKDYHPPLFRRFKWIDSQQSAILYQLVTTLWLFGSIFGLLISFASR
jgi:hypothetical protein